MLIPVITTLLIFSFSIINLFGIKPHLVPYQLGYFVIGFLTYLLVRAVGWRTVRDNSKFFYWVFVGLLVTTYVIGIEVKGSKRWIDLYFFNFQPSEFFKIFFIAYFADFFTRMRKDIKEFSIFLKSLFYFILPTFIIFIQPDLGNAIVFAFIYFTMIFFSKVPKKTILYTILFFIITAPLFWLTLRDYQKARVTSFFAPQADASGSSYNLIQAVIATGSGKFFGRGLGYGTQSKLFFLPENHTDFAYSSLVEQFGFFGGFCLIVLYFLLIYFLIKKIVGFYRNKDPDSRYGFLYSLGFFSYLVFQISINIGMNIGISPVVGIALPLMSYGGSSLVGFLVGLALLP